MGSRKELVELSLLVEGEREMDGLRRQQLVELVEVLADFLEEVIGGGVVVGGKHVVPDDFRGHDVEDETAEQAIFSGWDEVEDLLRGAGQNGRELWLGDFDVLTIFLSEIGNRFMVKRFPESIGVVAQVRVEGVGQGVAFCLEQKADTVVLGKGLIDHCGRAVGWNEQG